MAQELRVHREEEQFCIDNEVHCMGDHPLYCTLSWRGLLNSIKLTYDPHCQKAIS